MRRLCITALVFVAALVGPGCRPGSPGGAPDSAGRSIVRTATAEDVGRIDPALAFDTWSTAIVHAVTRRLVDYDESGRLIPDLAEEWFVEGGLRYQFNLRAGIRYADGTPITAEDFRRALERVRDPVTASPGADFYRGIVAVNVPAPNRLVIDLRRPDPTFLNCMGLTFAAPWPESADPTRPPASGPYEVETFEPGSRILLKRVASDPAAAGWVDRIEVQFKVEEPLQMVRFRSGEIDLLPAIPAGEIQAVLADPQQSRHVVRGAVNQTWYFGVNVSRPPWTHPLVRRAALLAINRGAQVQMAGSGREANGILPPFVPGYRADRRLPGHDPEAARRLLRQAGYDGSPRVSMWVSNSAQYLRRAELIQSDLAAVGLKVDLKAVTFSEYRKGYRNNADCWYGGWYPDFPDAGNFLEPVLHSRNIGPGKNNAANYRSAQVDTLLDQSHTVEDPQRRAALFAKAEDELLRDLPWIPLYFEEEIRYNRPGLRGVRVHPVWRQMLTGITAEGQ